MLSSTPRAQDVLKCAEHYPESGMLQALQEEADLHQKKDY